MQKSKTIWIANGGTGGHFLPGTVCGKALQNKDYQIIYWGEGKEIENHLCKDHSTDLNRPTGGGGRIKRGITLFYMQLKKVFMQRPVISILCGGYSSFITGTFCVLFRIPFVLLEQNTIPGKINRLLSRFALKAYITYPQSESYLKTQCELTGNPVREVEIQDEKEYDILIIGGSQGAQALNTKSATLIDGNLKIMHICGPGKLEETKTAWDESNHEVTIHEQANNIPELVSKSKWTITRAGATSLSEIAACQSAAIAVPFPYASDNHQYHNAKYLENLGAIIMLEENSFESKKEFINQQIADTTINKNLAKALSTSGIADIAGKKIVENLLKEILL
jgi:UDP-N-acetylglucosamine--N-acetylmuramyl-(pentapeptide) pyrophosphoryl-undecaprenol N-acetylglucosamine transferase